MRFRQKISLILSRRCVDRSFRRHPKAQEQEIYTDIQWLCLDGVEDDKAWANLNFDYMSLWHDSLQAWASGTASILSNRFQELSALPNEKQRERILEALVTFDPKHLPHQDIEGHQAGLF